MRERHRHPAQRTACRHSSEHVLPARCDRVGDRSCLPVDRLQLLSPRRCGHRKRAAVGPEDGRYMVLRHEPVHGCGGCVRGDGVDHAQLDAAVTDSLRLRHLQGSLHARKLLLTTRRLRTAERIDGAEHEWARGRLALSTRSEHEGEHEEEDRPSKHASQLTWWRKASMKSREPRTAGAPASAPAHSRN